jgi:radical SAM superfamily enzyme YgiQ (UPF0313 family)
MQIKFLFINAINPAKEIETQYSPLGIGYLISSIRKHLGEDAVQFKIIQDDVEQEIRDFRPDIVGISSVSQNYNKAIEYAKIATKYGIPVICGGVHISMLPSSLTQDMTIGVIGEGEETICELFDLFSNKGEFPKDDLRNINGIIYWDNDKILATEPRQLIYPLDKVILPARDLFKIHTDTYMFTSRGCPYRCTFCASSRFWNKVRFFSAEYVVEEIQHLVNKYNVKHIHFRDDLFCADMRRIERIMALLQEKKLLGKVTFSGCIRANLVNDTTIKLLKEMGVVALAIGLESGCNTTLKYLKGDNIDIRDNENAVKINKKYGITIYGSFIIGSPKENKEDILETLRFIRENHISDFAVSVLTPLPGTPVWDYAKQQRLVDEKMDWDRLNIRFDENYNSAIIVSEKLTGKEIYELFLRFERYRHRVRLYHLIRRGLQNPLKIPRFLIRKMLQYENVSVKGTLPTGGNGLFY